MRAYMLTGSIVLLAGLVQGCTVLDNFSSSNDVQAVPTTQVESTDLPSLEESGQIVIGKTPDANQPVARPSGLKITGQIAPPAASKPVIVKPANQQEVSQATARSNTATTSQVVDDAGTTDAVTDNTGAAPSQDLARGPASSLDSYQLLGPWVLEVSGERCRIFMILTKIDNRNRAATSGCRTQAVIDVKAWSLSNGLLELSNLQGQVMASLVAQGERRFSGKLLGNLDLSISR